MMFLNSVVTTYQQCISSQDIPTCKFTPSCSQFCVEAMRAEGEVKGLLLASDRIQRCHAFARARTGFDSHTGRIHDPVERYRSARGTRPATARAELDTFSLETQMDLAALNSELRSLVLFAEHLAKEGDYLRAAAEYQRYLYLGGLNPDAILFRVAGCYGEEGDDRRAIRAYESIIRNHRESQFYGPALFRRAYVSFRGGDFSTSAASVADLWCTSCCAQSRYWTGLLLTVSRLHLRLYDEAEATLDTLATMQTSEEERRLLESFYGFAEQGRNLPRKSPALAAFLSSLVPGAGKVYCGHITDGINSLVLTGLGVWAVWNARDKHGDDWSSGEVLLGVGTGLLYLGNIYGSYVAAEMHRDDKEREYLGQVRVAFCSRLPY